MNIWNSFISDTPTSRKRSILFFFKAIYTLLLLFAICIFFSNNKKRSTARLPRSHLSLRVAPAPLSHRRHDFTDHPQAEEEAAAAASGGFGSWQSEVFVVLVDFFLVCLGCFLYFFKANVGFFFVFFLGLSSFLLASPECLKTLPKRLDAYGLGCFISTSFRVLSSGSLLPNTQRFGLFAFHGATD